MKWYLKVLKQYATFSGRASRKEFWVFSLFNIIFIIVLEIFDKSLGTIMETPNDGGYYYGIFSLAYALITFVPALAVTFRRLHDIGLSGWWIFIILIPFLGPICFLVLMLINSNPYVNKYGAKPTTIPTPKKYLKQGDDAANIGNFENAIECYKKALDILGAENNGLTTVLHFNMGCAYYDLGEYNNALECFSAAQLADPASVEPHYEIGRIMQETGDPDGAIEAYELVIHKEPDYVDAHSNLGIIYLQQGKTDQAIACFQKAAQLGDESAQQWLQENGVR